MFERLFMKDFHRNCFNVMQKKKRKQNEFNEQTRTFPKMRFYGSGKSEFLKCIASLAT